METQGPNDFNQNPIDQQFSRQFAPQQQSLPNSVAVLVLGIISIVTCFCYGIIGLTCGIVALVLANKATKLYEQNPAAYSISSYNNMKAGKICAIIGVILSALFVVYIILVFSLSLSGGLYNMWGLDRY